jgi:hypothetical protein
MTELVCQTHQSILQVDLNQSSTKCKKYFSNNFLSTELDITLASMINNIRESETASSSSSSDYSEDIQLTRIHIIDWLFLVHTKLRLRLETLFQSIMIFDKTFFKFKGQLEEKRTYLMATVSLYIAIKYHETQKLHMECLLSTIGNNKFTKEEIIVTEMLILTKLSFKLPNDHFYDFLTLFINDFLIKNDNHKDILMQFACYIHTLAIMDINLYHNTDKVNLYLAIIIFTLRVMGLLLGFEFDLTHVSNLDIDMNEVLDIIVLLKNYYEEGIVDRTYSPVGYLYRYGFCPIFHKLRNYI